MFVCREKAARAVSLAATGRWLDGLGRIDGLAVPDPDLAAVADRLQRRPTAFGEMASVRCAEELPASPPRFALPAAPHREPPPRVGLKPGPQTPPIIVAPAPKIGGIRGRV